MTPSPDSDRAAFSRRDFLLRAGQVGAALSITPLAAQALRPPASKEALAHGVLTGTATGTTARTAAQQVAALSTGLKWRMLGPFRGGRVDAVTGVPGRPHEFYFGHVNGGVWKTVDGGHVWSPVFDGQSVASIGAIAVAPSAPDTLYVGTGERTLRQSSSLGGGVYKTTDGGKTWAQAALNAPVLSKSFTRFRLAWRWDGGPATLMSRAIDETGAVQPTRAGFIAERGERQNYHNNAIQAWAIAANGEVSNVYA